MVLPCKCRDFRNTEPTTMPRIMTATYTKPPLATLSTGAKTDNTKEVAKKKLGPTFLLILVPIRPQAYEQRALIRKTWYKGFKDGKDVMLRYVMGLEGLNVSEWSRLHDENRKHKDLVFLEHFAEDIRLLTNKTAQVFKWAYENVDYTYLMKCDDDTFVYVRNTLLELRKRPITTRLYYGVMVFNTKPIRDPRNKWYDPTWDLAKTYLPYARGGCYILSTDLVTLVAREYHHLKGYLNEDVSVGAWLAGFDYERRDDDLFCYISYNIDFHPCRKDYRVAHLFHGVPWPKLQDTFKELLTNYSKMNP